MNVRKWFGVGAMGLILACAGCIESTTLLTVNKDGSGTIMVREHYSPQMTDMMSGMGGMMSAMAGTNGAGKKVDFLAEAAKGKAAKFGPMVKQTAYAEKANPEGWKGFEARYRFPDVSKLKVTMGETESGDASSAEGKTSSKSDTAFVFNFVSGDEAYMEIIPVQDKKRRDKGGGDAEDMGGAMLQMMTPTLKGMRMTFIVQVSGNIVKTNAKYRSKKHPSTFVVMDLPMDKLLANPEAMKLMSSDNSQDRAKLAALKIPGVMLEDPGKAITVSFK